MAFDWEYFAKQGLSPAMQSLNDFMGISMRRGLSRQGHLQRMKEIGTEYDLRGQQTEYENRWREHLAKLNTTLMRSLIMDRRDSEIATTYYKKKLESGLVKRKHKNAMELANVWGKYGLEKMKVYRDAQAMQQGMGRYFSFNPDATDEINRNNFESIKENMFNINSEIQRDELIEGSIINNESFKQLSSAPPQEFSQEAMQWYKSQVSQLSTIRKRLTTNRNAKTLHENEFLKYMTGFKKGNPLQLTEEDAMIAEQMQFPSPTSPPKKGELQQHLLAIEECVLKGRDLPPNAVMEEIGLDPLWMTENWMMYRNFFRNRKESMANRIKSENEWLPDDIVGLFSDLLSYIFK